MRKLAIGSVSLGIFLTGTAAAQPAENSSSPPTTPTNTAAFGPTENPPAPPESAPPPADTAPPSDARPAAAEVATPQPASKPQSPYDSPYWEAPEPPEPPPAAGVRTHDGFFFRGGIGIGYVHNSIEDSGMKVNVSGTSIAIELMFGGTPAPGLVIGVGLWADPLINPQLEISGETVPISDDVTVQLSRLGPFIDWYPNPKNGLHLFASITLTAFSLVDNTNDETIANAKGPGFGAGIGYEWWIGKQWSAGAAARFVYAPLSAGSESDSIVAPALGATFTYH